MRSESSTTSLKFQDFVLSNWKMSGQKGLVVAALGLGGEAGECQEYIKKIIRGDGWSDEKRQELLLELGDCLHYLTVVGQHFGFTLEGIMAANVEKLEKRYGNILRSSVGGELS